MKAMKRIAIAGALVAALVFAAVVVAQGPGPRGAQPPPGERGRGGPPRHPGMGPELGRLEREYAAEVRQAHKEIAEQRRTLDEKVRRLGELWHQAAGATAEERAQLRPDLERLVREVTDLEVQIAERQLEIAEKGLELALERLVEAKVAVREAHIKKGRREAWLKGEWGKRLREHRRRERTEPQGDVEEAQDEQPEDAPEADQPDEPEE